MVSEYYQCPPIVQKWAEKLLADQSKNVKVSIKVKSSSITSTIILVLLSTISISTT
jgi:hypothetical protein